MEGELQKTVGINLRLYRQRKGLSQEDFAHELGVHRTYMVGVERGERNLTLRSVERFAESLGITPLDLLAKQADFTPQTPDMSPSKRTRVQ